MKKTGYIIALSLVLMLCVGLFAGCGQNAASPSENDLSMQGTSGGVLRLKVNPEIAISYDADGNVTAVDSRNDDAKAILEGYDGFVGKETRMVVKELVNKIGEAGYFVEEIDGSVRTITIEIEAGSGVPDDQFLSDIADDVRGQVSDNQWRSPLKVSGGTDYGLTDYADTDYGIGNDGDTNYANDTDYGPQNDGITSYGDSDYGTQNDGVTDYRDDSSDDNGTSNYGASSDSGNSNYVGSSDDGNSNYGGSSDSGNSNYGGNSDDGNSNYGGNSDNNGNSNYGGNSNSNGNSNYGGNSDNNGNSNYGGNSNSNGNSNYGGNSDDNGNSNYGGSSNDDGYSNYGGNSGYGNSDYGTDDD